MIQGLIDNMINDLIVKGQREGKVSNPTWKVLATNHSCIHKCNPCNEKECFLRIDPQTKIIEMGK